MKESASTPASVGARHISQDRMVSCVGAVALFMPMTRWMSEFIATVGGAPLEIVKQYIEQQKSV
jgi:REP element-mobilizing transposase RayT